jgi:molybdopterin-guanine dinucleotide biosynthesis protein A/GNAT superfamily N-acetyltransferase
MVDRSTVRMAIGSEDQAAAADLIRQYVASLAFVLDFQDVDAELTDLSSGFGGERGALFLAVADEAGSAEPVGVVGVRMIDDGLAELKRMYLRPEGRGRGLGRRLAEHAIAAARRLGAARIVLDTDQASMAEANALYESLGFVDIDRYRENPLACARFMGLDLIAGPAPAVGVVPAGGSSSRMGRDKPGLEVAGRPMIEHVATALAQSGVERVMVAGRLVAGLDGVPDPPGLAGPVAGLLAAFRRLPGRDVLLVAADQPMVAPATLRRLLDEPGDAVVPVDGARQTTCAVYRHACYPALERLVASDPNPSLQHLLDLVATTEVGPDSWRRWGEDGRSWRSIDTPDELAAVRADWPDGQGS